MLPSIASAKNKYDSISQCHSAYEEGNPNASHECYTQFPMSDCETIDNPHIRVNCYGQCHVNEYI